MIAINPNKFILDATAGYRMMWFDKNHPNTLYLDKRPECEPDQVADWTKPLPYDNEQFRLVIFDPPHWIKTPNNVTSLDSMVVRTFGYLKAETWQSDLKKAFKELWRILMPYGVLLFKWSDSEVSASEVLGLFDVPPLVYQVSGTKQRKYQNGDKKSVGNCKSEAIKTVWFCFMKIPNGGIV